MTGRSKDTPEFYFGRLRRAYVAIRRGGFLLIVRNNPSSDSATLLTTNAELHDVIHGALKNGTSEQFEYLRRAETDIQPADGPWSLFIAADKYKLGFALPPPTTPPGSDAVPGTDPSDMPGSLLDDPIPGTGASHVSDSTMDD